MNRKEIDERVPDAVIGRLPIYYRILGNMIESGQLRTSSSELAANMGMTASVVRQDLGYFGGFGQKGYGYGVKALRERIGEILGIGEAYGAVIIGAGTLGAFLASSDFFADGGVFLRGIFDHDPEMIGKTICGHVVKDTCELSSFVGENRVEIAVLALPGKDAAAVSEWLVCLGVRGIWNFSSAPIAATEGVAIRNIHPADSLMEICFKLREEDDILRRQRRERTGNEGS